MRNITQLYFHQVFLSEEAAEQLPALPLPIIEKVQLWTDIVENMGLKKARRIKQFHDCSLNGRHSGLRTIDLSDNYFAVYAENQARLEIQELQKVEDYDG